MNTRSLPGPSVTQSGLQDNGIADKRIAELAKWASAHGWPNGQMDKRVSAHGWANGLMEKLPSAYDKIEVPSVCQISCPKA